MMTWAVKDIYLIIYIKYITYAKPMMHMKEKWAHLPLMAMVGTCLPIASIATPILFHLS
jgi:hypothetical protein